MTDVELDMTFKKDMLKKQGAFSRMTDEEAFILAEVLKEKKMQKGEVIVSQGDPVDTIYIIVEGEANVDVSTASNYHLHTESVATLNAGQAIGLNETGFYSLSGRRTATVTANTDMILLCLSVAAFHGFALAYPHVNELMRKTAAKFIGSLG